MREPRGGGVNLGLGRFVFTYEQQVQLMDTDMNPGEFRTLSHELATGEYILERTTHNGRRLAYVTQFTAEAERGPSLYVADMQEETPPWPVALTAESDLTEVLTWIKVLTWTEDPEGLVVQTHGMTGTVYWTDVNATRSALLGTAVDTVSFP